MTIKTQRANTLGNKIKAILAAFSEKETPEHLSAEVSQEHNYSKHSRETIVLKQTDRLIQTKDAHHGHPECFREKSEFLTYLAQINEPEPQFIPKD